MRIDIDMEELAGALSRKLQPQLAASQAVERPALLSRKVAAKYLGVSVRMFDRFGLPRVLFTDHSIRFRREDLDHYTEERLRS